MRFNGKIKAFTGAGYDHNFQPKDHILLPIMKKNSVLQIIMAPKVYYFERKKGVAF